MKDSRKRKQPGVIADGPWGQDHAAAIAGQLVDAYQGLCIEWMTYRGAVRERMTGTHADSAQAHDDQCLHQMLTGLVRHSKAAAHTASTVTPVWVSEPITAMISGVDLASRGIGVVSELGSTGLLLFETPPVRAQEALPPGTPRLPAVDVDGVLWFTKVPGIYRRSGMVMAPLTRSRALSPLRGDAWRTSTLTEITCFDIESDGTTRVQPGMRALADVMVRMGIAVQRGDIRVIDGDGLAARDGGVSHGPAARLEAA